MRLALALAACALATLAAATADLATDAATIGTTLTDDDDLRQVASIPRRVPLDRRGLWPWGKKDKEAEAQAERLRRVREEGVPLPDLATEPPPPEHKAWWSRVAAPLRALGRPFARKPKANDAAGSRHASNHASGHAPVAPEAPVVPASPPPHDANWRQRLRDLRDRCPVAGHGSPAAQTLSQASALYRRALIYIMRNAMPKAHTPDQPFEDGAPATLSTQDIIKLLDTIKDLIRTAHLEAKASTVAPAVYQGLRLRATWLLARVHAVQKLLQAAQATAKGSHAAKAWFIARWKAMRGRDLHNIPARSASAEVLAAVADADLARLNELDAACR